MSKELGTKFHVTNVSRKELVEAALWARKHVSGFSKEKRAEYLEKGKLLRKQ
jgi:hypothetical protein